MISYRAAGSFRRISGQTSSRNHTTESMFASVLKLQVLTNSFDSSFSSNLVPV